MLRKMTAAAVLFALSLGLAYAEEFGVRITKVDGNKISAIKGRKKDEKGTEVSLTAVADVKVLKGKVSKDGDKFKVEPGDAVEDGLKAKIFSEIGDKGVNARVTTNDDGKVTQIIVFQRKKKAE